MGKRSSKKDADAGEDAGEDSGKKAGKKAGKKHRGKPASMATVLRPVLIGAAALALVEAVLAKVL
jgi:hypothetical protein